MSSRYRALVVHAAEQEHRPNIGQVLMQLGFTVIVADFAAAKEIVITHPPDLLVTDVRLGAYNGLHLVIVGKAVSSGLAAIVIGPAEDAALRGDVERAEAILVPPDVGRDALIETLGTLLRRPIYPAAAERRGPDRRRSGAARSVIGGTKQPGQHAEDISEADRIETERRGFVRRRQDRLSRDEHGPDALDLASDSPSRTR
jgi:DNA-binding NtrC family response regulator